MPVENGGGTKKYASSQVTEDDGCSQVETDDHIWISRFIFDRLGSQVLTFQESLLPRPCPPLALSPLLRHNGLEPSQTLKNGAREVFLIMRST
jgi:hypothetical protein